MEPVSFYTICFISDSNCGAKKLKVLNPSIRYLVNLL